MKQEQQLKLLRSSMKIRYSYIIQLLQRESSKFFLPYSGDGVDWMLAIVDTKQKLITVIERKKDSDSDVLFLIVPLVSYFIQFLKSTTCFKPFNMLLKNDSLLTSATDATISNQRIEDDCMSSKVIKMIKQG